MEIILVSSSDYFKEHTRGEDYTEVLSKKKNGDIMISPGAKY
jgi:hypothetical protein